MNDFTTFASVLWSIITRAISISRIQLSRAVLFQKESELGQIDKLSAWDLLNLNNGQKPYLFFASDRTLKLDREN